MQVLVCFDEQEGLQTHPKWCMRQEHLSRCYTTLIQNSPHAIVNGARSIRGKSGIAERNAMPQN
ncbi:MAG: DUF4113 domain-containing protein [Candidatus Accumulibacter sp.]|nr:DUF4113 domain-containing protein [Accumulibacter sp.]